MSTQLQLRRGSEAQCDLMTPAEAEPIIDLTNDRFRIGDGSLLGGIHVPNYKDIINQRYGYALDTGTVNAMIVTLYKAFPGNANARRVTVKPINTNTGACTLKVDSETALSVKIMSGGSLIDPPAGTIGAGGFYDFTSDGTYWILMGGPGAGAGMIGQGDLDTSQGVVSFGSAVDGVTNDGVLPGGEYGFYPNCRQTSGAGYASAALISFLNKNGSGTFSYSATVARWSHPSGGSGSCPPIDVNQRYINASPPYELDGSEVAGFLFMLLDKDGQIAMHYIADAPPWAYNGPTNIRPHRIERCVHTGKVKKFRRVMTNRSLEQILNGAQVKWKEELITPATVNKDMDIIPHPFPNHPDDHTVVLVNPHDPRIGRLIEVLNAGGADEINNMIRAGFIRIDNDSMKTKGPRGVRIVRLKYSPGNK